MDDILKNLRVVADQLESNSMFKEAKMVDRVIRKVAARNTIDIDARVNGSNMQRTQEMIGTYTRRIGDVQKLMANRSNPASLQKLKDIASHTDIAPDSANDYEGVLSLLESGLQKYKNHLTQLTTGGQAQKPPTGDTISIERLPETPASEPSAPSVSQAPAQPEVQTQPQAPAQQPAPVQKQQPAPVEEQTEGQGEGEEQDKGDVDDASIKEISGRYGIPYRLLKAMVDYKGINAFLPETVQVMGDAKKYGPKQNLDKGAKYLSDMYKQFKTWPMAVGAFQAGPESVARYGNKVPPFATNYVNTIMNNAGMAQA